MNGRSWTCAESNDLSELFIKYIYFWNIFKFKKKNGTLNRSDVETNET